MKLPLLDSLAPKRRNQVVWFLRLLLIYAVIGFLILPPIIKSVATSRFSTQLHRDVSIKSVRFNPFALSISIRGLLIKDLDGEPFVSWDEVYVNFQLSSFLGHPWVFKEISTSKPYVRVQVNKDRTFNFTDLIEAAATNPPSAAPSKPLAMEIGLLHIGGAAAAFTDLTMSSPFKRLIGPVDVTLTHFHTDPESKNPYAFTGTTDAGERLTWSGFFSLSPLRSGGDLMLENFSLNKYSALYQDFFRFKIRDGVASTRATYALELSQSNRVASLTNTSFTLASLQVANPAQDTNFIEQQIFTVSGASVDAVAHHAEIKSISASGGRLRLQRNPDATINVVELTKPVEGSTNAPGSIQFLLESVTNAVALLLNSTNNWRASIDDINIHDFALSLEDLANSRPANLELDNITFTAQHISNVPDTNLTASLSLRWNTNGTIKMDVAASFNPPTADIHLALDQLDLHPIDPYLESKVNVLILGSKLGMDGQIHLRTPKDQLPEVTFSGDAWLDDFDTVDGVLGEELLKWQSVRLSGMEANLNPPVITIKQIAVNDAYARVVIGTNHTINLLAALNKNGTNAEPDEESVETNKLTSTKPEPAVAAPTNSPALASLPKITISTVVISNAQMRFSDESLKPNVNLSVQQVNGTISGLSSEEMQHADVNLHALVDNVGPVDITGTINPFVGTATNDLKVSVKDVDLTPTSPYAGKFAGYRIAKGKLSLDLDYHIVGQTLQSKNVITLDQFTFGEKVVSPDASKLPVRLAVAVLKDRDGKIVLDVPIDGSLSDPKFKLGKVISRALLNILTKVVTSPFAVLGAVFGGHGDEISYQNFTPGSADLLPTEQAKLDSLMKGMFERPGLQLAIEGSIDPDADRMGLQRVALEKQMKARKWTSLRKSERATNTVDQVVLTAGERADYLKKFYGDALSRGTIDLEKLSANTNNPAAMALLQAKPIEAQKGGAMLMQGVKAPEPTATDSMTATTQAASMDPMEWALLTTFPVTDSDLQTLAASRAKAVRDYIQASGKVDAGRLFLTETQPDGVKTQGSRVYLQFQ